MNVLIINGPNLNLLGVREPGIYGSKSFDEYLKELKSLYLNFSIDYYQSNHEGGIIDKLHEYGFGKVDGIILNAGAYTHTSIAIADAISAISTPVIEVHISNVHSREQFRRHSFISPVCIGVIAGFGLDSYRLGLESIKEYVKNKK
ncbi:MAG: type II 3-dehydroquinate dehydratase [Marinilabiliaceae bacterium]|nr:type II 3-dehydroquinate dehydratase [Marinilabiliaceae bacterium]